MLHLRRLVETRRTFGGCEDMTKKTTGSTERGNRSRKQSRKAEPIDLLELGPDQSDDLLELEGSSGQRARIKVIGVGGGGGGNRLFCEKSQNLQT